MSEDNILHFPTKGDNSVVIYGNAEDHSEPFVVLHQEDSIDGTTALQLEIRVPRKQWWNKPWVWFSVGWLASGITQMVLYHYYVK